MSPRRYRPCFTWSSPTSRTYPSRCAAKVLVGYTRCGSTSTITPGSSSFRSSTCVTSSSESFRRTRTGRNESGGTRSSESFRSVRGILRRMESRASTVSRSSTSRGMSDSVNAGRLSTSGRPLRSNRMPRGAATGRTRMRFFSDISCRRPPSRACRYQSWPSRPTKAIAVAVARTSTRRLHASSRLPGPRPRSTSVS